MENEQGFGVKSRRFFGFVRKTQKSTGPRRSRAFIYNIQMRPQAHRVRID